MLKATYVERAEEAEGLNALANEWFGNDYAKQQRAVWETNVFQILLDDVEGVNTRLNERPTVSLVLASKVIKTRHRSSTRAVSQRITDASMWKRHGHSTAM